MATINRVNLAALEQVIKEVETDCPRPKGCRRWKKSSSWRRLWPRLDDA